MRFFLSSPCIRKSFTIELHLSVCCAFFYSTIYSFSPLTRSLYAMDNFFFSVLFFFRCTFVRSLVVAADAVVVICIILILERDQWGQTLSGCQPYFSVLCCNQLCLRSCTATFNRTYADRHTLTRHTEHTKHTAPGSILYTLLRRHEHRRQRVSVSSVCKQTGAIYTHTERTN